MRTYDYICDECGHIEEVIVEYGEEAPDTISVCPKCGDLMRRSWMAASIVIPSYMRAGAEGDLHSTITNRMKHGARPSGRQKSLY